MFSLHVCANFLVRWHSLSPQTLNPIHPHISLFALGIAPLFPSKKQQARRRRIWARQCCSRMTSASTPHSTPWGEALHRLRFRVQSLALGGYGMSSLKPHYLGPMGVYQIIPRWTPCRRPAKSLGHPFFENLSRHELLMRCFIP